MKAAGERGSVAVLAAAVLPIAVGIGGLALELSMAFERGALLQQVADSAALTAAQQLDGTAAGVANAFTKAAQAASTRSVRGVGAVVLGSGALSFAGEPSGPWQGYDAALAAPSGLRYVRTDMAALGAAFTTLPVIFGSLLGASAPAAVTARAVAGPNGMRVLPLAVCAPSSVPVATRANGGGLDERVDYGFRFGVGYNLLALNAAAGAASGEYFLVDPLSAPGGAAAAIDDSQLAPFMCIGKLAYPSLTGRLHLRRGGPFGLWRQLNSRFGSYGGSDPCDRHLAPADSNVREYRGTQASWMSSYPPQASAASSTPAAGKPLMTVADRAPPLAAVPPAQYGTLWAYGAAKKSNNSAFTTSSWAVLYPSSPGFSNTGTSWPSAAAPYNTPAFATQPGATPSRKERRLLYVPLLSCPIAAGAYAEGTVLAVARFLLTAQASASEVPGEFAGILSAKEVAALATDVELLQ
ncbi:pilus assembly protein TadG-related protein [Pseudoduganella violaceinigra]|uniref:pilus assembly protein TadG-related protein n=1 Tax=Pseudoduganella violaceinigra TaxID=246602 RepID=UPI00041DF64D|nr:pilus assembly protein TadG-related protein [Pseudoduganella violaceinigra]